MEYNSHKYHQDRNIKMTHFCLKRSTCFIFHSIKSCGNVIHLMYYPGARMRSAARSGWWHGALCYLVSRCFTHTQNTEQNSCTLAPHLTFTLNKVNGFNHISANLWDDKNYLTWQHQFWTPFWQSGNIIRYC